MNSKYLDINQDSFLEISFLDKNAEGPLASAWR